MTGYEGYLRFPHVRGGQLVFTAEDDVWLASTDGGPASRLTSDSVPVARPRLSPDGSLIAWMSRRRGEPEVFVMPTGGGPARQLTYFGHASTMVHGFAADGRLIVLSAGSQPFRSRFWAYAIDVLPGADATPQRLSYGPVNAVADAGDGRPAKPIVVGTGFLRDYAWWKRYRGGTGGRFWIADDPSADFSEFLADLGAPKWHPNWLGERLAFISDVEGHGNVYSVAVDGSDLRRHTDHDEFFARQLAGDTDRLVYQHAGELFLLDSLAADSQPSRIDVTLTGSRSGRAVRRLSPAKHLGELAVDHTGRASALEVRGNLVWLTHRNGPVPVLAARPGVRFRLPVVVPSERATPIAPASVAASSDAASGFAPASVAASSVPASSVAEPAVATSAVTPSGPFARDRVAYVTDADGPDSLELVAADGSVRRLVTGGIGRVLELIASPDGTKLALATHDGRLLLVSVSDGGVTELEANPAGDPSGLAFSPDSRWLAYSAPEAGELRSIRLVELARAQITSVTRRRFIDSEPVFSADGQYLVFLSARTFDPVYDAHVFDLSFPLATRPYLVTLAAGIASPFEPELGGQLDAGSPPETPKAVVGADGAEGEPLDGAPTPITVDLDGIENRVVPFPVAAGRLSGLLAVAGGVVWTDLPVAGELGESRSPEDDVRGSLQRWDFSKRKQIELAERVDDVVASGDGSKLVLRDGDKLKLVPADEKPSEDSERSLTVDLARIQLSVDPPAEWRQMLDEMGRLMIEHFWIPDMGGVDWDAAVAKYRPVLDRIASRDDLSDVLWEVNGETGSSHAYEIAPAGAQNPETRPAFLGADLSPNDTGAWVVTRVVPGDNSSRDARSPLTAPGVDVRAGDVIVAVNGRSVPAAGPAELLLGTADKPVELTTLRAGQLRSVAVVPLASDQPLRYLDWVSTRRAIVHEATGGRVGYVHVPDMVSNGWAAMHRDLRTEFARDGLILDTRDNQGGHTSQLVIEKLARRIVGWDTVRFGPDSSYPGDAPRGPVVSLANEWAGSDGDIVNAAFQSLELGPVLGTRTWGGVVGIDGRYSLVDGTGVTQPRYSFWFERFGWGVENYGVDPDVVVEFPPQAWGADLDPQLAAGIRYVLEELERRPEPARPDLADRPDRAAPPLPPRRV
ncbi:MAG: tri [Frankiales bacterium]|nr:tri [Frankiales bacterium]